MSIDCKHGLLLVSFFFIILLTGTSSAQSANGSGTNPCWGKWQVSLRFGTQMSGIKDEDFVASNYAPLLDVSAGKWFSPSIALQVGYKGWYFHTIADEEKHNYGYYHGEVVINVNSLFRNYREASIWSIYVHGGAGYFYNYSYNRPNVCGDFGITNNVRFLKNFQATLDVAAIAGWDIYQGDADILPGVTIGISYRF